VKILVALTYYRPHTSGLTIYTERLAHALARRGHEVTILTSRFDRALPPEERHDGLRIIRVPVWFKISKGVVMPTIVLAAGRLAWRADAMLLHLPQFDAAGIAFWGRLFGKPIVLTYHCDLRLPLGIFNGFARAVVQTMNNLAALLSHIVVTNTSDYADHSSFLSRFRRKLRVIPPPVEITAASETAAAAFRNTYRPDSRFPLIGMVTRFAAEKGIEVLLRAFPEIIAAYPDAKILFVGQYRDVIGEREYLQRLLPEIARYEEKGQWRFLGLLPPEELSAFYGTIDLLCVPSLNSTESFGLVQIEAMMHGTPVIVSDLPGMRQPVLTTGMGATFRAGDSSALAAALRSVLGKKSDRGPARNLEAIYVPDAVARRYEEMFHDLSKR